MNHLLAKIKNRTQYVSDTYKKVISDENVYTVPDNLDSIDYNPNTLLEDGQWYRIREFSSQEFCIDILKQANIDTVDLSLLSKDDFTKIDYLCSIEDNAFYFQKIRPSQLIVKKRISFGDNYKYDAFSKSIVINMFPDAIYKKADDTLYFKKLESITTIFKGIDILYKEATEQETDDFLHKDFITLANDFNSYKVGKSVRKKIALAVNTLNDLTEADAVNMVNYIKSTAGLEAKDDKFIISNEKDLKKLLFGILERYYTTEVSKKLCIANSVVEVTK